MSDRLDTLYALYVLGELEPAEAEEVEAIVDADPIEAAKLHAFFQVAPTVAPSPQLRQRLLASAGGGRFENFSARLADLYGVSLGRARELLGLLERTASWESPLPGAHLLHFIPGTAYANADCGFVRIEPGAMFPWHLHRGEERCVVLEGSISDHEGQTWTAGDLAVGEPGSTHELRAGSDGVLFAARVIDGIDLDVRKP
jgi:quercetin dioxygenase-like cupin family protein